MKTTVQTSRGPVRFHSVGEPIVGIPAQPAHTPGDWNEAETSAGQFLISSDYNGKTIAVCYTNAADAHLLASAPELLESLEGIRAETEIDIDDEQEALTALHRIRQQARAAIAKAKGQP